MTTKNKILLISEPGRITFEDRPGEDLPPGHVRIHTLFSGISHGTEMAYYRGTEVHLHRTRDAETGLFAPSTCTDSLYPTPSGYESVGEVIEIADDVSDMKVGDRVFAYCPHQTEIVTPVSYGEKPNVLILPDGLQPELGIFFALADVAFNAILDARLSLGETVVIFGLGVVGQMLVQLARLSGAEKIIGVDLLEQRRALALASGADAALDACATDVARGIMRDTANRGADAVFECSGSYRALHEAIRCAGSNGTVIALSNYQGEGVGLRLGEEFHQRRVTIKGSMKVAVDPALAHWTRRRRNETVMRLLPRLRLRELISHTFDFTDAATAFALIDERPQEVSQVILRY